MCAFWHKPEQKGTAFRHDGVHPQGNRAGCHWRHSAALGFACGDTVLTVAVLAIVLTAPLGAFAMNLSYKKLLKKG
ncbi:hypothetical protein [Clostridium sp. AF29-8BH]|uniref:hypothetical protein n=1 Tax=Clostridium sp. AF29-8BH TaxID=2293009 RepID=UPI00399D0BB3